jgi:hypothetical protein
MGILDWAKGGDHSVMSSRRTSVISNDEDQSLLTEGEHLWDHMQGGWPLEAVEPRMAIARIVAQHFMQGQR